MAKLSEMAPDEAKEHLYSSYMSAHDAVSSGEHDGPHPSKDVTRWSEMAASGQDEGGGLGPVSNFKGHKDQGGGLGPVSNFKGDNPPATPGTPKSPVADPGKPSMDSQHGVYVRGLDHTIRFVPHGGRMLPGDVEVHTPAAVPTTAASQRRMASLIPGYDRILKK